MGLVEKEGKEESKFILLKAKVQLYG